MTAAEPDNDQEPASLFAGAHLLAVSPRNKFFFLSLSLSYFSVFFHICGPERLTGLLGCIFLLNKYLLEDFYRKMYLPPFFGVIQGISSLVVRRPHCSVGCATEVEGTSLQSNASIHVVIEMWWTVVTSHTEVVRIVPVHRVCPNSCLHVVRVSVLRCLEQWLWTN